jgi:hypothetical protein
MRSRNVLILGLMLCLAATARAELSATDGFEGSSGDWTTAWRSCSEFDGGLFTNTSSKITGANSLGLFGNSGSDGTGVRRAFMSTGGQIRFRWSCRADYDVTSDDGNGGLSRRMAFTFRNGDDTNHFTGQRLSFFFAEGNANFAWYDGTDRNTNAVTFSSSSVYDCDVTVSTGLRTYTLSVSNRNNGAKFTYSGSWTTGTAGDNLDSVSFLMRGPSGTGNDAFLDEVNVSQAGVPWPGGATAGYASDPASRIHHFKEQPVIGNGYILCMLDFNGSLYDIYYPSVGNRQGSGTANEGYRGAEEFPSCPLDAEANGQMNVINAMGGIGVIAGGTNSIHWLKNQVGTDYTNVGQQWLNDDVNIVLTTNKLNISGNNFLVQQYDFVPSTDALPIVTDGIRTNYGVYVKRFLLTNLEATDKTIDFYYDANFNVKGANIDDGMYFETAVNGTNYNAMVVYDNTFRSVTGTGCSPNGYGDDGVGNFDATRNYKPTSFGASYDRGASVYFATVMKMVTNSANGLGLPADGSWRDHTSTDNQEGWIGKRLTIPAGQTNEVDVMIVGSWDDAAAQTGTYDFWGRPVITWFYTNSMATAQTVTEGYWSNWVNSGVTIDLPGTDYDRLWKRQLLVSAPHQDRVTGAIIAGSHNGAYPFCWPRDGCYAAIAFARTGHTNETLNFFHFLNDVAFRDTGSGFTSHHFQKYSTDGYKIWAAAQPDESASVPWAMFYYYSITGDAAYLTNNSGLAFSTASAVGFAPTGGSPYDGNLFYDATFNLVHGNNVWEDSNDEFIYSNAAIVRGLRDAANIADLIGNASTATAFRARANLIKSGIDARIDARVEPSDISHVGLVVPYEVYEPNDTRMTNMVEWIHGRQASGGHTDTLVEGDAVNYPDGVGLVNRYIYNVNNSHDNYWNTAPSPYGHSPWFLATSWYGEYFARWQDYLPGKSLINTNYYTLNLLTNKMDQMLIGAEQIAPKTSLQKYPGFWLQTSWPNLWEADLTLVDQIMMFLDYKPQATNNTCYFAPKLPSAWSTMTFNNLLFRNQRFNITVSETPTTTRADINKLTSGALNVDIYLRILAGTTPVMVVTNGNYYVPSPSDYNTTTGRVHIQGPLTTATGVNSIVVTYGNNDYDADGLPDAWELQYGLSPLDNGSFNPKNGPNGDPDGDGMSNINEFLAGTDPIDSASALQITSIVRQSNDINVTWKAGGGKTNMLQTSTGAANGNYTTNFIDLPPQVVLPPSDPTVITNKVDVGGATNVPSRFYRIRLVP